MKSQRNETEKNNLIEEGKLLLLPKCATWHSIRSRFIKKKKKQETSGLLSSSWMKTTLSKIPLWGNILFWMQFH